MNGKIGKQLLNEIYYHTAGGLYISPRNAKFDRSWARSRMFWCARLLRAAYAHLGPRERVELQARLRKSIARDVAEAWDDHRRASHRYPRPDRRNPLALSAPSVSTDSFPVASAPSAETGGVVTTAEQGVAA